jgi:anti-sigma regulatory factor (Ser/Thr protein kinase)
MEYFVSAHHWLDGANGPQAEGNVMLLDAVKKILQADDDAQAASTLPSLVPDMSDRGERDGGPSAHSSVSRPGSSDGSVFEEWRGKIEQGFLEASIDCDHQENIASLSQILRETALERGFSKQDATSASIALSELLVNVQRHVQGDEPLAKVEISFDVPSYKTETLTIRISDSGTGIDLPSILFDLEQRLSQGEREHGLLRCYRLGDSMKQADEQAHTIVWRTTAKPKSVGSLYDELPHVTPVVYDFETDLMRIGSSLSFPAALLDLALTADKKGLQAFIEIPGMVGPSLLSAANRLTFDPIRRAGRPMIGLEVRGSHPTMWGIINTCHEIAHLLVQYRAHVMPNAQMIVFANAMPEDNCALEHLAAENELPFFESEEDCLQHLRESLQSEST